MKDGLLIHTDYCLTPNTTIHNAAIVIRDGHILAIGGYTAFIHTEQFHVIEMPECYMLPGFVDTHLYGAGGYDCMHADTDPNVSTMSTKLAEHGVTSFVHTTQSCSPEKLLKVVDALGRTCHQDLPGAVPVGVTVEGPYLSNRYFGAHPEEYLRPIDLEEVRRLIDAGGGQIRILTFAPELAGADALIDLLTEHDIIPCLGHTAGQEQHIKRAVEAGATRCSHLYNGMPPLSQREFSLAGIALTDQRVWVEIIADGVHIHPGMIDLACRAKPKDHIIGISNSTEAAGLADGKYQLGDKTIYVKDGRSYTADKKLAGSVSFLDSNYRYMLDNTHLEQGEVGACFTLNAVRSIGLNDRGVLKPGKRADVVILDKENQVQMTIVSGRVVYDRANRLQPDLQTLGS